MKPGIDHFTKTNKFKKGKTDMHNRSLLILRKNIVLLTFDVNYGKIFNIGTNVVK